MSADAYVTFGADTGELEAGFALARAETRALASEMTRLGSQMQKAGAAADSEMGQHLKALGAELSEAKGRVHEFQAGLRESGGAGKEAAGHIAQVREVLYGLTSPLRAARQNLGEIAELFVGAFALERVTEFTGEITEAAEKIERMAAELGASTGDVQRIGAIAALTGTDFDQMASQLERLQLQLARTGEKSNPAANALKALNLNAVAFKALSIPQQVDALAAAFANFADGPRKTAASVALLGRAGADLLPILDRGKQGIEELNATAAQTGFILSSETVGALAQTREDLNALSLAWSGFARELFAVLNPAVDAAVKELTSLVETANPAMIRAELISLSSGLIDMAAAIAKFAVGAREDWSDLVAVITGSIGPIVSAANAVANALNVANEAAQKLGAAIRGGAESGATALTTPTSWDAILDQKIAIDDIGKAADAAKKKVAELLQAPATGNRSDASFGGVSYNGPGAAKPQVPEMDLGGGGRGGQGKAPRADESEITALNEVVKKAQDAARDKEKAFDDELSHHRIGVAQWLTESLAVLNAEATAVKRTYDQELALANLTANQIATIHAKEVAELRKISEKMVDDQRRAADETKKEWENAADTIASAFNSQLKAVLSHSETMRQAMGKIAEDIALKFAEKGEMIVVNWLADQAAMKAGSFSGIESGLESLLGGALKAIAAGAGQVAAGVAGFLAPFIGPAAVPAGIAAGAAIEAGAKGIGAMDIGAWQIPESQLALVHKNELVMPSAEASAFRSMLSGQAGGAGGQGQVIHHHHNSLRISALDSRSFVNMLEDHRSPLAKMVATHWQHNPSSRPKF